MIQKGNPRIYWANAMFSAADRDFNSKCTMRLREAGYQVFLPQETSVNKISFPSARDIFRIDTSAIIESDFMIACIDQETIDCGVASEIGIAFAYGVPVIGLYTDMRQYRKGESCMYKNPYVVGAIEANGEVLSNIDELLEVLHKFSFRFFNCSGEPLSQDLLSQHFDCVAPEYSDFVEGLESWYEPSWTVEIPIKQWLDSVKPGRVLDFGCGLGNTSTCVLQVHTEAFYVGYDQSNLMIQYAIASKSQSEANCIFTSSWAQVREYAEEKTFDMALLSFVLHDLADPSGAIRMVTECLRPGGTLLIIDLSTLDLPRLTELLRNKLARPHRAMDRRLDPVKLTTFARSADLLVTDCNMALPSVHFPSPDAIDRYLRTFGVYLGMDLPLTLSGTDHAVTRRLVQQTLKEQVYPFTDQRAFFICALQKEK